jgi:NodT family efflux transporter outer membrane factor (OMF) lipoprotein
VGPDFHRPAKPEVGSYLSPAEDDYTTPPVAGAETSQRFVDATGLPRDWWKMFGSPELDAMVERALRQNPGLQSAIAALRAARENTAAQRGAFYPQVTGSLSSSRQRVADPLASPLASGESLFNLHTAQLSVSYALDVFGLNRRTVEGLEAQEESQRWQLEAAYLTLTSNVVAGAIQEASLRGQLEATHRVIGIETEQLGILRKQFELGAIAEVNVIAQETALAQTESTVPQLEKALRQQRHALAALVGELPADAPPAKFELASLTLPRDLPLTVASSLVDRRPDVRAAEAQLHAASAAIGVATANMLPQITLSADAGTTAQKFASLFGPGTSFWSATAGLAQPIFQGGMLQHRKYAAEAVYDQAAAQYRAVVVAAFQNVADALAALDEDAHAAAATRRAESLAADTLDITRRQLALGDVSFLATLAAQQAYNQAVISRVQAEANRLADTAALFQALGGGWQDEDL